MKRLTPIQDVLSQNIKRLRKAAGLTQARLAEAMDISTVYLAELESGKKNPSLDVLQKIAVELKLRPYELFLEEGVDDQLTGSHVILRSYAQDTEKAIKNAVNKALSETSKKYF